MKVHFFAVAVLAASLVLTGCGKGSGYDGGSSSDYGHYDEYELGGLFGGSFEPAAINEASKEELSESAGEFAKLLIEGKSSGFDESHEFPMGIVGQNTAQSKAVKNLNRIADRFKLMNELLSMPIAANWENDCDLGGKQKYSGDSPSSNQQNPSSYNGSWKVNFINCKQGWGDGAWIETNGSLSIKASDSVMVLTYDNLSEKHSGGDTFSYNGTMTIYYDSGASVLDIIVVENGETYRVKQEITADGSVYTYYDSNNGDSYVVTAEYEWNEDKSTDPSTYSWKLEFCYPEEGCVTFEAKDLQSCSGNTGWFQSGSYTIRSQGDWVKVEFKGCSGNFTKDVSYSSSF